MFTLTDFWVSVFFLVLSFVLLYLWKKNYSRSAVIYAAAFSILMAAACSLFVIVQNYNDQHFGSTLHGAITLCCFAAMVLAAINGVHSIVVATLTGILNSNEIKDGREEIMSKIKKRISVVWTTSIISLSMIIIVWVLYYIFVAS
jgi:hypothetical protein